MLCIESTRTPSQRYPQIWDGKRVVPESRFLWERAYGPIPDGFFVCHECDNPRCIRLEHLFLGTNSDNQRDSVAKGRHPKTRIVGCPHGHPYSEENTQMTPAGHRQCRVCNRRRSKERYWAKKAAA